MREINLNADGYVVMSNDLIKSKSNLSLNELKLLRVTIMQIMASDLDLMTYEIPLKSLGELLQIPSTNLYRDVQEMCRHLLQELIYVSDGRNWKIFQWCSCCEYRDGIIKIKLHDSLKPYLLELKGYYTQYVLEDILLLKSKYAIRIYELIRESLKYQKVYADNFAEIELDVNTIRTVTNTESKYKQMGHFKEKVIDKAIKEINDKLNYVIYYKDIKKGRKITGFCFIVKSKASIK